MMPELRVGSPIGAGLTRDPIPKELDARKSEGHRDAEQCSSQKTRRRIFPKEKRYRRDGNTKCRANRRRGALRLQSGQGAYSVGSELASVFFYRNRRAEYKPK